MQQTGEAGRFKATGPAATALAADGGTAAGLAGGAMAGTERKRVEAVVETLANLRGKGENLAEVAHDARNMVTALGLYCDLLEEPGVLTPAFHHYANELRLVATASRRLVEKLLVLDSRPDLRQDSREDSRQDSLLDARLGAPPLAAAGSGRLERVRHWDLMPAEPLENLAGEVLACRNLLSALAGPAIALTMDVEGGVLPVQLTGEDLTRILVNLVKNAAEAMRGGGRIAIGLHEFHAGAELPPWLMLTIEDDGPGIPRQALESIFESGFTTRAGGAFSSAGQPACHRGLGLSITRSIIEAGGGHIHAVNRAPAGARFEIELPVRSS